LRTRLHIVGLETYGYHGFFVEERTLGQKFVFDIELGLVRGPSHLSDDLGASIRYDEVTNAVVSLAGKAKYRTLETLAESVSIGLLQTFILLETVTVAVYKFSPPIPHTLKRLGVSVSLSRGDLGNAGYDATSAQARS